MVRANTHTHTRSSLCGAPRLPGVFQENIRFLMSSRWRSRSLGGGSQSHTDGRLPWPAMWAAVHMAVVHCRNWRVKGSIHDALRLLTTSHCRPACEDRRPLMRSAYPLAAHSCNVRSRFPDHVIHTVKTIVFSWKTPGRRLEDMDTSRKIPWKTRIWKKNINNIMFSFQIRVFQGILREVSMSSRRLPGVFRENMMVFIM